MPTLRRASPYLLAGLLASAGVTHFVVPDFYERMIPAALPGPRALVYGSGVAELACAGLVAHPRTRRFGAWTSAALFVAVFPANVQMALDARDDPAARIAGSTALSWARLPLQVPLVVWAVSVARRARRVV